MAEFSKYDSDPEALAWARANVQRRVDHYRYFERQATKKGDETGARKWRMVAWRMEQDFIGGEGCVVAAFDERLPKFVTALSKAVSDGV